MTSSRPYLIRALYEWINDNGMTPYVMADASIAGVAVPQTAIQKGKVTLNMAAQAIQALQIGDHELSFSARFGGVARKVVLPMSAIGAIYARENGQGMMFPEEPAAVGELLEEGTVPEKIEKPGGHLKVVK